MMNNLIVDPFVDICSIIDTNITYNNITKFTDYKLSNLHNSYNSHNSHNSLLISILQNEFKTIDVKIKLQELLTINNEKIYKFSFCDMRKLLSWIITLYL